MILNIYPKLIDKRYIFKCPWSPSRATVSTYPLWRSLKIVDNPFTQVPVCLEICACQDSVVTAVPHLYKVCVHLCKSIELLTVNIVVGEILVWQVGCIIAAVGTCKICNLLAVNIINFTAGSIGYNGTIYCGR